MNLFTFILFIIVAGLGYELLRQRNLAKLGHYEDAEGKLHTLNDARKQEMERELEDLRERVKVLERIATDGRETRALADEIDRLRDS